MKDLTLTLKEQIQKTKATISFDYATQMFSVKAENGDVLFHGAEVETDNWLTKMGAKYFTTNMQTLPDKMGRVNTADLRHMDTTGLLELLRLRQGDTEIVVELAIRENIKSLLGEDTIIKNASGNEGMVTDTSLELDTNGLNKVVVDNDSEKENASVFVVIAPGNVALRGDISEKYAEAFCGVLSAAGFKLDSTALKEALNAKDTVSVFEEKIEPVEQIVEQQSAKYESTDLNRLSASYVKVKSNSKPEKWTVSEIKEDAKSGKYYFEVFGEAANEHLSDTRFMSEFLVESVKLNRNTSIKESDDITKAVFAVSKGLAVNEALDYLSELK